MTDILDEYYAWWHDAESMGLPGQVASRYYQTHDSASLFTVTVGNREFSYPMLTMSKWIWPESESLSFQFDSTVSQKSVTDEALVSSISRMAFASDETYISTIEEAEEYVWNGEVYTPTNIENDTITVGKSDFYSILSSQEPLIRELNFRLFKSGVMKDEDSTVTDDELAPVQLPYRDDFASSLWEIISLTHMEPLPIGGTYPMLLRTADGGYELLFSRRSTNVASWPEYVTVTPAGYFAPDGIDDRLGVLNQFFSEYCEELFGEQEGSVTSQTERVQQAAELFDAGLAEFQVTGFGVEAVGLSFEVSGVFIVHNASVAAEMKESFDLNYEVDAVECVSLDDVERFMELLHPERITPPSAFAIVNALQYLKSTLDDETKLAMLDSVVVE